MDKPAAALNGSRLPVILIILLAIVSALGPGGMNILLPALPIIRAEFGITTETVQLALSVAIFAIALGSLTYGPLSDKYGRIVTLLSGLAVCLIGCVIGYFATTIEVLVIGRFIQAFGASAGLVIARAIVRDVYEAHRAAHAIATITMIMTILPMISPMVGGLLMDAFGWPSVFICIAVTTLILGALLYRYVPETLAEPVPFEGIRSMLTTFMHLMKSSSFCAYAFCVAFMSVVFFSFLSAAPEIMVSVLHRPPTEFGYYFIMLPIGFATGNNITRYLSTRFEMKQLIAMGIALSLIGTITALALQLLGVHHPLALFVPVAVAFAGNGISMPNAQAAAINEFPNLAGSASGLTGFLQMSLSAAAAQIVAALYNGTVYPLLFFMICASLLALCCFVFGLLARR